MSILPFLLMCGWVCCAYGVSNSVIDISNWQRNVNFGNLKKQGIEAVIHKTTEGTGYTDPYFACRKADAMKHGLLFGAYHFAHGGNPIGQADHFLKVVGDTKKVLLVLDLEPTGKNMSPNEAEEFVKHIKAKTGRFPMIYGSSSFLNAYNKPNLNKCGLWIASYTTANHPTMPRHRKSWELWQYTDGKIGGSPKSVLGIGSCDRDRFNGTPQQLRKKWPHL